MVISRTLSSLSNVMAEFDAAAKYLALEPDQIAFIKEPRCSLKLNLPVQLDNGRIKVFRAYHTIHSIMRGPSIGGVQFRPDIDIETVEALAFWSTHRCALLGIPFGGSYGAVECDPSMYSVGELERISRRYVAELVDLVKPNNDVMTSDIGTNQQVMCWFMDTYSAHFGNFTPAVVSGKPKDLGGVASLVHPASVGVDLCIRRACEHTGLDIKKAKVAIQGFGKVGMNVARLLAKAGAKITAVADISGAYFNERGINIEQAVWHQQSYGILDGLEGELDVKKLDDPLKLFELPVDIIVPAAIELQIMKENVANVKAKIIAEAAHDPVSPIADKILHERGTLVIPDILCNSGGVTGYYLEWVQNRMGYYWSAERMNDDVSRIVGLAFDEAMSIAKKGLIPLRLAATVLALKRVVKAAELRGVYA